MQGPVIGAVIWILRITNFFKFWVGPSLRVFSPKDRKLGTGQQMAAEVSGDTSWSSALKTPFQAQPREVD
jgi:hypothetical protein